MLSSQEKLAAGAGEIQAIGGFDDDIAREKDAEEVRRIADCFCNGGKGTNRGCGWKNRIGDWIKKGGDFCHE